MTRDLALDYWVQQFMLLASYAYSYVLLRTGNLTYIISPQYSYNVSRSVKYVTS